MVTNIKKTTVSVKRYRSLYYCPVGYGIIIEFLMLLVFVLFTLPVTFLLLCFEIGPYKAWRVIWDLD